MRVERDYVLRCYSEESSTAIQRYNDFVYAGIDAEPEIDFKTGIQSGIIGNDSYIQDILERSNVESRELEFTITGLLDEICERYGVSKREIISQNKRRDLAHVRAVLALLSRDLEEFSIVELAKILNRKSSGLSRLAAKLDRKHRNYPQEMQEFKALIDELHFTNRTDLT